MNLRSITVGSNIRNESNAETIRKAAGIVATVRSRLTDRYPKVRTTRLCTQPLTEIDGLNPGEVGRLVKEVDRLCRGGGVDWFCIPIGECYDTTHLRFVKTLPTIMRCSEIAFSNVIATQGGRINFEVILECARQVLKISKLRSDGFDNFRFCVSANVKPNGAFFPYSWHRGEDGFSIGLEAIDLIIDNVRVGGDLVEIRDRIRRALSAELEKIDSIAREVESEIGVKYYGVDLSLAPYPTESQSIGRAIEYLGAETFGVNGTLFLTSYLTNILKCLERDLPIRTVGFTGVMYPVLEDRYLAHSNDEGFLSVDSLLLYSSVCGCGPDMIPLPGDISEREVASIMLDMSALALILDKPLVARLVPIPRKREGQRTKFNYHFFHNTRIMAARNRSLTRKMLKATSSFEFP
ncbi:MAG: DUF711 family protein [Candidatus Bathyarchaeia archaeon]|nr:DUF711 family protein [Candidatus Bathyarchaeota archaeon]